MGLSKEPRQGAVPSKVAVVVGAVVCLLSTIAAAQQGVWTEWRLVTPLPQPDDLFASATGDGTTVAVGRRGTIVASADGVCWDITHPVSEYDLYDVTWTGEEFVAVGGYSGGFPEWTPTYGVVLASTDGRDWHEDHRTFHGLFWAVESTPDATVAVGVPGIAITRDGLGWTEHNLDGDADDAYMSDLTFDGARFVAVGFEDWDILGAGSPAVFESLDGSQWSLIPTEGTRNRPYSVAWGNGRYVALDDLGVLVSFDGRHWASVDCGLDYNRSFSDLEFSDGWFSVFAHRGAEESHLLRSSNGESWVVYPGPQMPDLGVYWVAGLAWTGEGYVVVSVGGFMASAAFHQALGLEWTEISSRLLPRDASIGDIEHAGSVFLAVGDGFILRSVDGLMWERYDNPRSVRSIGGIDGEFWGTDQTGRILHSADGISWELRYRAPDVWFGDVAGGEHGLLAVGGATDGETTHAVVAMSEDGYSWDLNHLWDLETSMRSVAWNGHVYVAVAWDNRLLTSSDGTTWQTSLEMPSTEWNAIAAGNGRFVVVGDSRIDQVGGLIVASTDGMHWVVTELDPVGFGGSGRMSDVTWTGNRFVAVRDYYGVVSDHDGLLTSRDGISWIRDPVGYGYRPRFVAGDDQHLVVARVDVILRATHQPIAPRRASHRLVPDP